jgi:pimeloyl-ACP methyl ester carboxylesterase
VIAGAGHWAPYEAADAFNAALRKALTDTQTSTDVLALR